MAPTSSTPSPTSRPRCRWARASWRRPWRQRLIGLAEGTRSVFELAAGEAFGERNPELLQRVKRSAAATSWATPTSSTSVGDVVQFPTPDGQGALRRRGARGGRRLAAVRLQPPAGRPAGDLRSATDRGAVMSESLIERECCWPSRAASAPAWTARSRSSSVRCSKFGAPIYVRHEIVHNTYVVNDLKAKGAIFIEDLADVPPGATLVFSAHGVSQAVRQRGRAARLQRVRRHLPAGDQGARRGGQAAQGRLRLHHDRPQGPPRGRGHDGPARRRHLPGRGRGRRRAACSWRRPSGWRW